MTDFARKARELSKPVVLGSAFVPGPDPYANVAVLTGERMRVPATQVPKTNPMENSNVWRYTASGNYTNILQGNGGSVQVFLTRNSGTGPVSGPIVLRALVQNPDGALDTVCIPFLQWISSIVWYNESGAQISSQDGGGLWNNLIENTKQEDWTTLQKVVGSNNSYDKGDPLIHSTTTYYYPPLIGNPLSPGKFFIPGNVGDCYAVITFAPSANWLISGPSLNLTELTLEVPMAQLPEETLSGLITEYKMAKHDWFYPYERIQTVTQTWTAGNTYQIQTSAIAGNVVFMRMGLYKTLIGQDIGKPARIAFFWMTADGGAPITTQNQQEDYWNRYMTQRECFDGTASRRIKKYAWVFPKKKDAAMELIREGVSYPGYAFTNKENMYVTMASAGTNEIVTITPSSAPTSGTYQIGFSNPDVGIMWTAPLAFNATASTIQSAINNLLNFGGVCTVAGTMATAITITYTGGGYETRPMAADGYQFSFLMGAIGTTYTPGVSVAVATPGVSGITSGGTYTLKMWFYTTSRGCQEKGSVYSRNSG